MQRMSRFAEVMRFLSILVKKLIQVAEHATYVSVKRKQMIRSIPSS